MSFAQINALRQKRAETWDAAKAFLNEHADANGNISAEDTATYERMEAEITDLGNRIAMFERAEGMENAMNAPAGAPITNIPNPSHQDKTGRGSQAYQDNFWKYVRNRQSHADVHDALEVGTDSEGGYLVPDEFEHKLVQGLEEENIMRTMARKIRTSSGDRKIPVATTKGTASWVDEEGAIPESDDAFSQVSLSAYKVATAIRVSEELLNDSAFNLQQYISNEFARRIGRAEEEAFITGDGTGKPTGFLTNAELGVTAASATAVTSDELMDLYHSLLSPYRKKAAWMMNDATVKLIRKLKDGNQNYLWQPGLVAGQPDTLLNRPIKTSAFMPTAAAGASTIAFGDFSYYWIADRQNRSFRRLNELYAMNGQVAFIATQRVDGKLILTEAIKRLSMKAAG